MLRRWTRIALTAYRETLENIDATVVVLLLVRLREFSCTTGIDAG